MGTHSAGPAPELPRQTPLNEGQFQLPEDPADAYPLPVLADYLTRHLGEMSPFMLETIGLAIQAERNRRQGMQGVVVELSTDVSVVVEAAEAARKDYVEAMRDFMNPESHLPFAEQFDTMSRFWDARGLDMPDPAFTDAEIANVQVALEQNPNMKFVATPLPLNPFERTRFFYDEATVQEHSNEGEDGGDSDDERLPAQGNEEQLADIYGSNIVSEIDDRFLQAYQAAVRDNGVFIYSSTELRATKRGKSTEPVVVDKNHAILAYKGFDGMPIYGRREYLNHMLTRSAGARQTNNGRFVWTYQLVDVSRPQAQHQPHTPQDFENHGLNAANTPELEITLEEIRNDGGVYEPNALQSSMGRIEPQRVMNEAVFMYKTAEDGSTVPVATYRQIAVNTYAHQPDTQYPRGVHFLATAPETEPDISFTTTTVKSLTR